MTSEPVALLLADLGVTKTHARPHVSNDNPFSEAQFDEGGKRFTIQWQPGKGDFGSGNAVRVCIERSGFAVGAEPPNDRECWSIGTDPL